VGIYGDAFAVGSMVNGGTVQALTESAFNIDPMVGAFTNCGLIEGGSWDAVFFGGAFSSSTTRRPASFATSTAPAMGWSLAPI
jgi:hypothetical protein